MKHQRDIQREIEHQNDAKKSQADILHEGGLSTFKKNPSSYELRDGRFFWIEKSEGSRVTWDYVKVREWQHITEPNFAEFESFLQDIRNPETYNVANRVDKATLLRNVKCIRYILDNTFAYTLPMTKNQWRNKLFQVYAHLQIGGNALEEKFNVPHLFVEAFLVGYLVPDNYFTHRIVEQESITRPVIDKITGKRKKENKTVKWTMYSPQYIHRRSTLDGIYSWRWAYQNYADPYVTRERVPRLDPDTMTYKSADRIIKRQHGSKHLKRMQLNEKGRPYRPKPKTPTAKELKMLNERIEYLTNEAKDFGRQNNDQSES